MREWPRKRLANGKSGSCGSFMLRPRPNQQSSHWTLKRKSLASTLPLAADKHRLGACAFYSPSFGSSWSLSE